jgi:release factor glutamine methyltransferase
MLETAETASLRAALQAATVALRDAGVDAPELDALLLLAAVLGVGKAAVLAHPERELGAEEAARYRALVARRAAREPLAYVLGRREFYGRSFAVTPAVLVPRPESELLVALALEYLRRQPRGAIRAADVGTGSGALAVTLAAEWPELRVRATDCSPAALAVARANVQRHGLRPRVRCFCDDLLAGADGTFALIVANLPYIPSADIATLMPEVAQHEPRLALDGGPDGLVLHRRLLAQATTRLAPGGLLLLEMGADQGAALRAEAERCFPGADVAVARDLAGLDRVLRVGDRLSEAL